MEESSRRFPLKLTNEIEESFFKLASPSTVISLSFKLKSSNSENGPDANALMPTSFILFPFNSSDFRLVKV